MALPKYNDVIKMAKDALKEMMAPLRAREMKKKAELEMAKLEGRIAEQNQMIQELCSAYPIDFDRLIDAQDELGLSQRRLEQFRTIVNELFD